MYVAVVSAILGQGLQLGSSRVLEDGALVWLLFHLFVLLYEALGRSPARSALKSRGGFRVSRLGPQPNSPRLAA
jgi:hypothetical protein